MKKVPAVAAVLGLVCGGYVFGINTNDYVTVADQYINTGGSAPAGTTANNNGLGMIWQGSRASGSVPLIKFATGKTWFPDYITSATLMIHAGGADWPNATAPHGAVVTLLQDSEDGWAESSGVLINPAEGASISHPTFNIPKSGIGDYTIDVTALVKDAVDGLGVNGEITLQLETIVTPGDNVKLADREGNRGAPPATLRIVDTTPIVTNEYITVADDYLNVSAGTAPAGTTSDENTLGLLWVGDRATGGGVPIIQFDTGKSWYTPYIAKATLLFHAGGADWPNATAPHGAVVTLFKDSEDGWTESNGVLFNPAEGASISYPTFNIPKSGVGDYTIDVTALVKDATDGLGVNGEITLQLETIVKPTDNVKIGDREGWRGSPPYPTLIIEHLPLPSVAYETIGDITLVVAASNAPAGTVWNDPWWGHNIQGNRQIGGGVPILQFDTAKTWILDDIISASLRWQVQEGWGAPGVRGLDVTLLPDSLDGWLETVASPWNPPETVVSVSYPSFNMQASGTYSVDVTSLVKDETHGLGVDGVITLQMESILMPSNNGKTGDREGNRASPGPELVIEYAPRESVSFTPSQDLFLSVSTPPSGTANDNDAMFWSGNRTAGGNVPLIQFDTGDSRDRDTIASGTLQWTVAVDSWSDSVLNFAQHGVRVTLLADSEDGWTETAINGTTVNPVVGASVSFPHFSMPWDYSTYSVDVTALLKNPTHGLQANGEVTFQLEALSLPTGNNAKLGDREGRRASPKPTLIIENFVPIPTGTLIVLQ